MGWRGTLTRLCRLGLWPPLTPPRTLPPTRAPPAHRLGAGRAGGDRSEPPRRAGGERAQRVAKEGGVERRPAARGVGVAGALPQRGGLQVAVELEQRVARRRAGGGDGVEVERLGQPRLNLAEQQRRAQPRVGIVALHERRRRAKRAHELVRLERRRHQRLQLLGGPRLRRRCAKAAKSPLGGGAAQFAVEEPQPRVGQRPLLGAHALRRRQPSLRHRARVRPYVVGFGVVERVRVRVAGAAIGPAPLHAADELRVRQETPVRAVAELAQRFAQRLLVAKPRRRVAQQSDRAPQRRARRRAARGENRRREAVNLAIAARRAVAKTALWRRHAALVLEAAEQRRAAFRQRRLGDAHGARVEHERAGVELGRARRHLEFQHVRVLGQR